MDDSEIDYKTLLIHYIQHVVACESVDFLLDGVDYFADVLTPQERTELNRLAEIARLGLDKKTS